MTSGSLERFSERIGAGARTPEGKVIAVFLAVCLALMTWNVSALSFAMNAQDATAGEEPVHVDEGVAGTPVEDDPDLRAPVELEPADAAIPEAPASGDSPDAAADAAQPPAQDGAADAADAAEAADADAGEADLPAQEFQAAVGGVGVKVAAPHGAFPRGTSMRIAPVVASNVIDAVEAAVDGEVVTVSALDIGFSFDGDQIQPQRSVTVTFTGAALQGDEARVFHMAADGTLEEVDLLQADADVQSFEASSFSTFVAVGVQHRDGVQEVELSGVSESGVRVTISGMSDVLPRDWRLEVTDVWADVDAVSYAVGWQASAVQAVEATLWDAPDSQVALPDGVLVRVSGIGLEGDDVAVLDGDYREVATAEGGAASYRADSLDTITFAARDAAFTVTYLVPGDDGQFREHAVQTFVQGAHEAIGVLPENPFLPGSRFAGWYAADGSGSQVRLSADTVVDSDMVAYAAFEDVGVRTVHVDYYYVSPAGDDVVFASTALEVSGEGLPRTIASPGNVAVPADVDAQHPIYYPEQAEVVVDADVLAQAGEGDVELRVRYVPFSAEYDYVYYLRDLDGEGYGEIARLHAFGVLGDTVTAPVRDFGYASFQSAEPVSISQEQGQEVPVYYERKSYTLAYDANGGSYVESLEAPYGTLVRIADQVPTRKGCTFTGWYLDEGLVQPAGESLELTRNTRLYAGWDGKGVEDPQPPTRDGYDFAGWWTQPEGGELYGWSEPEGAEGQLYAHWTPAPVGYTVRYLDDETGSALFPEKQVSGPALQPGQQVSETAASIMGYRPDAAQKSLQLGSDGNVIEFRYSPAAQRTGYRVEYVLASDPDVHVAPDKVVDDVEGGKASVVEAAAAADPDYLRQQGCADDVADQGYYPQEDVVELALGADPEENVITFRYDTFHPSKVVVNYVDMDGSAIPGATPSVKYAKMGSTYTLSAANPAGYTRDHVESRQGDDKSAYVVADGDDLVIDVYCKRNVSIAADGKQKRYDGSPLESRGVGDLAPQAEGLVAGDAVTRIEFSGQQTDVGASETTPQGAVITRGGVDVSYYYEVDYIPATLEVRKR